MRYFPTIVNWLDRLMQDERRRLLHFSVSAVIFFVGYWMLHWTADNVPPSLDQELSALAILIVTLIAFVWAIFMQILYIISRIKK